MSAVIRIRGWSKSAAAETGTAKANATTAVHGSASNVLLGRQSAATKTASTKATAEETTTETSSVETTATTGPCRLTKRDKSGAY